MTTQLTALAPINELSVGIDLHLRVQVLREARRRCPTCNLRRVLYRFGVHDAIGGTATGAQCARCWGFRA